MTSPGQQQPEDPLEARLRRELHAYADQIEPTGTLAQLRTRIRLWRLRHRRHPRLHRSARSTEDPPTLLMPPVPDAASRPRGGLPPLAQGQPRQQVSTNVSFCQPTPRCVCGRPSEARWSWCCWVCRAATDGGWTLGPWRPGIHWTAAHTWACEQRRRRHAAVAWRRTPDDPPLSSPPLPSGRGGSPADVWPPLAHGARPHEERRLGGLRGRHRAGQPSPPPGPDSRSQRRQPQAGGGASLMPSCADEGCPRVFPSSTACHCHGCHQTFGTLTLFDHHQDWEAGWASLSCRPPLSLGLVLDHNGTWQTPQGLQRRQQDRLRLVQRGRSQ